MSSPRVRCPLADSDGARGYFEVFVARRDSQYPRLPEHAIDQRKVRSVWMSLTARRWPLGEGEVVCWTSPHQVDPQRLASSCGLAVLLAVALHWRQGRGGSAPTAQLWATGALSSALGLDAIDAFAHKVRGFQVDGDVPAVLYAPAPNRASLQFCADEIPSVEEFGDVLGLPRDAQVIRFVSDAQLRALLQEVAGHDIAEAGHHAEDPAAEPYPGLGYFDEESACFYFGREQDLNTLWDHLARGARKWIYIWGPSGSGKSSLVRAGLVPRLRDQGLGAGRCFIALFRPQGDPVGNLADAVFTALGAASTQWPSAGALADALRLDPGLLASALIKLLGAGETLVLVADQFEECAASPVAGGAGEVIDDLLSTALAREDCRFRLITAIRADRASALDRLPKLDTMLNDASNQRRISRMPRSGLLRAIEEPARAVGFTWADGLPERIADEVENNPAALPLMSHALRSMWSRRDINARRITVRALHDMGDVAGALARDADRVFAGLSSESRENIRKILINLVQSIGDTWVRRASSVEQLSGAVGDARAVDQALDVLSGRGGAAKHADARPRLITCNDGRVELVHETLCTQWATLRSWLEEGRAALALRDEVTAAAAAWVRGGCDDGALPEGATLERFLRAPYLDVDSREYLRRAQAKEARSRARETRRAQERLRLRRLLMVIGWAAVFVPVAVYAVLQQRHGRQQEIAALDAKLSATEAAALSGRHAKADAQLRTVVTQAAELGADGVLESARGLVWRQAHSALRFVDRHARRMFTLGWAEGSSSFPVASTDFGGLIRLWDPQTDQVRVLSGHSTAGPVNHVVYDAAGAQLASAGFGGDINIWDVSTGELVATAAQLPQGEFGEVRGLAWDSSSKRFLVTTGNGKVLTFTAGDASPRELADCRSLQPERSAISADRSAIAVHCKDMVRVWRIPPDFFAPGRAPPARLDELTRLPLTSRCRGIGLDSQAKRLAISCADAPLRIINLEERAAPVVLDGSVYRANQLVFSPGDRFLAAAFRGGIRVWDLTKRPSPLHLEALDAGGAGVAFSPDNRALVAGNDDSTVRVYDLTESHLTRPEPVWIQDVIYGPESGSVLAAMEDGAVRSWAAQPLTSTVLTARKGTALTLDYVSAAGTALYAVGYQEGVVEIRSDLAGPACTLALSRAIREVAFDPTGRHLAIGSADGVWVVENLSSQGVSDCAARRQVVQPRLLEGCRRALPVVFTPDGRSMLAGSVDEKSLCRYRWQEGVGFGGLTRIRTGLPRGVLALAVSPDGARVAVAGRGPEYEVLSLGGNSPSDTFVLADDKVWIWELAFSPTNANLLAVGAKGGHLYVRDLDADVEHRLVAHVGDIAALAWRDDGQELASGGDDGIVYRWKPPSRRPLGFAHATDAGSGELISAPGGGRSLRLQRELSRASLVAPQSDELGRLYLWGPDQGLQLVSSDGEQLEKLSESVEALSLSAYGAGVVVHDQRSVLHWEPPAKTASTLVDEPVEAIGVHAQELLVARGHSVMAVDLESRARRELLDDAERGITRLLVAGDRLIAGYHSGEVLAYPLRKPGSPPDRLVDPPTGKPVTLLEAGPGGTIVAGFRGGTVGLWDLTKGLKLRRDRLYGRPRFLRRGADAITVASDLGDSLTWRTGILTEPPARLLERVLELIPVEWRDGRARYVEAAGSP